MSNAFAPIVRARPDPIFGRPVHQGSPPIDYSPILLLKPFGFRIAPDTLSSDENLVGQRGITPAFGYSAPHPSAGGTLTLLIHALPSAHYVYIWADGIYLQARMEPQAECMLVLIGATPEGKKELLGFQVGVRESAQSWRELLVDL